MIIKKFFWGALFCSGLLYLAIIQVHAVWPFTIDDMFISLRYAKHWADGDGLVWNVGDRPLEGYSNFTYVLLARLALKASLDPIIFLKGFGVLSLWMSCLGVYILTRFWALRSTAWIPCLWLLAYRGEIIWSVSGLETTLYQALLTWSVVFFLLASGKRFMMDDSRAVNNAWSPWFAVLAGVIMAIASMTRPEAPVMMAAFMFLFIGLRKQLTSVQKTSIALGLLVFLGVYAPYFLWRWHLFGYLFSNPIYCKIKSNDFLKLDRDYLHLLLPFVIMAMGNYKKIELSDAFLWLPSIIYGLLLMHADPIVAFNNRLFLPAFALFLPFAFKGLQAFVGPNVKSMVCASILVTLFFVPFNSYQGYRVFTKNPEVGEGLRREVVQWLNQHTHDTDDIVLADCGYIPYYTPRHFIDSYCLNNEDMAHLDSKNRYQDYCELLLQKRPSVIVLTALVESEQVKYAPVDACLVKLLSKTKLYSKQLTFRTNGYGYYKYEIYVRR